MVRAVPVWLSAGPALPWCGPCRDGLVLEQPGGGLGGEVVDGVPTDHLVVQVDHEGDLDEATPCPIR